LLQNFKKLKRTSLSDMLGENATTGEIDLIANLLIFDPNKRATAL
jgi:hypothetical protein